MPNKMVLVTGGAGFIGTVLSKKLVRCGYQVVVLDNLSCSHEQEYPFSTFVHGDVGDRETLVYLFSTFPIEAVMHLAAFSNIGESCRNPGLYYRNNFVKTVTLLKTMVEFGMKTFIFSSSASIYGIPQQSRISEQHSCQPINPYGRSKLMVEEVLEEFDRQHGVKFCSLRYFNAAGADPEGEVFNKKKMEHNLIPLMLQHLLDPIAPLTLFGSDYDTPDGTCIRDYIHVEDLCHAHIAAMEHLCLTNASSCYNLGSGRGHSVREVISAAEKVTGRQVRVVEAERRPGDPAVLLADSSKAKQELGWQPQFTELEPMIAHAWQQFPLIF